MNDIDKLADMALAEIPAARTWKDDHLHQWLAWMDASGCLIVCYATPEEDTPLGFCVVRPITNIEKKHQRYHINHRGRTLYCDMAIAPTLNVMRALGIGVLQRFGVRDVFASSKNDKLKIHNFHKTRKALLKQ